MSIMKCRLFSIWPWVLCGILCSFSATVTTAEALAPSIQRLRGESPLAREARSLVPDPAHAVVLPEAAFLKALREGETHAADSALQNRARRLNALANDPAAIGILATVRQGGIEIPFAGSVFLVVREPTFLASGKGLQTQDFYVAAVELRGRSPWIGGDALVMLGNSLSTSGGVCCGPAMICATPPQTTGPCDSNGFCNPPDVGIASTGFPALQQRLANGGELIDLQILGGKFTGAPQQCTNVVAPECTISLPRCGPGDEGYLTNSDGTAQVPAGSSSCGSNSTRPAQFNDVPPVCQVALSTGDGPFCGGLTDPNPPAISLSADFMPPGCALIDVPEGSNVCMRPGARQNLRDLEQLALRAQFVNGVGSRCELQSNGIRFCTTCSDTGCTQTAQPDNSLDAEDPKAPSYDQADLVGHCWAPSSPMLTCGSTKQPNDPTSAPAPSPAPASTPAPLPPAGQALKVPAQLNSDDPPPPNPTAPRPATDVRDRSPREFFPSPATKADPIALGSGAMHATVTDLGFASAVRDLEFRRYYNSQSDDRSALGSNWGHNWDIRVEPVGLANARSWMLPYCAGSTTRPSCVVLSRGDGYSELFYLDYGSMLYLPQGGSTTTVASKAGGGWAARTPDGRILMFDQSGALVQDRDRFGNGFTVENEPTPLARLFDAICSPRPLSYRNETLTGRRCSVLAFLLGRGQRPLPGDAWSIAAEDFDDIETALPGTRLSEDPKLRYALAYLLHLVSLGPTVESADGMRSSRVVRVRDDLARTLEFEYQPAPETVSVHGFDFTRPGMERLQRLRGPAGAEVQFEYGRPHNYDPATTESFLVKVKRHNVQGAANVVPAVDRETRYEYAWPGGPADTYLTSVRQGRGALASEVYSSYFAYYSTYIGCAGKLFIGCGNEVGLPGITPGDPAVLARIRQNEYMGRIADNLVTVIVDGVIESETRYEPDPWELSFDRVTAQRYGSLSAVASPAPTALDAASDRWKTGLPKAAFRYASAGVPAAGPGDITATFLPPEIRARYPLDTLESDQTAAPPTPTAFMAYIRPAPELATSATNACNADQSRAMFEKLPGWRQTHEYYEPTNSIPAPTGSGQLPAGAIKLARTRLTCEQLAVNQLGDPLHNDLVSVLQPNQATADILSDHFASRVAVGRSVIARDVNRICAWTRYQDRDGTIAYYGMNFRGQPLVEARAPGVTSDFTYLERIYNADGMLVEDRRPDRGTAPWQPTKGYTAFTYDEVDPTANRGWDGWLPAFWSRRGNVVRVERRAASGSVTDIDEQTGVTTQSLGRYEKFAYEPLYNQVAYAESGAVRAQGATTIDVPTSRSRTLFDYQEASGLDARLDAVLNRLAPWGFNWLRTAAGGYDYAAIAGWQWPQAFYGRDLNDDGVVGFGYSPAGSVNTRSAAVRIEVEGPAGGAVRTNTFVWAPHGLPAQVVGPDGETTVYRYYRSGAATTDPQRLFGDGSPPTSASASSVYSGLVAEVRRARFGMDYDLTLGPSAAPCTLLSGPYQWLLPSSCSEPKTELIELGLPRETVEAVLAASTPGSPDRWRIGATSYSVLGLPYLTSAEGHETHIQRDTDGRVVSSTDPMGNVRTNRYSSRGELLSTKLNDAAGTLLTSELSEYDVEGRPLRHCVALLPGGCTTPATPQPRLEAWSAATYFPEGLPATQTDAEGLQYRYEYDEWSRMTTVRWSSKNSASARGISVRYTVDGQVSDITHGLRAPVQLTERLEYDGLQRVVSQTDTRQSKWQFGYSNRDLLVRRKQHTEPYAIAASTLPLWEAALQYDALGRIVSRTENGIEVERRGLTGRGLLAQATGIGRGTRYTTFDLEGREAWAVDGVGSQKVFTYQPSLSRRTIAEVHQCCTPVRRLAVAQIERLDALDRITERVEWGRGDERATKFVLDGLGRVREQRDALGSVTRAQHNLVGWVVRTEQQSKFGIPETFDVASYEHDRMGRVTRVVDPASQVTKYQYSPFGELLREDLPGSKPPISTFEYDDLGRLAVINRAGARIARDYDTRGDPVADRLGSEQVTSRSFDALGRLVYATTSNPAHSQIQPGRRRVALSLEYDALGRVASETTQVGQGAPRTVNYKWTSSLGLPARLETTAPMGASQQWRTDFDSAGRMVRRERRDGGASSFVARHWWLGTSLAELEGTNSAQSSPLREVRTLDSFGSPVSWEYRGIRIDASGQAIDPSEAQLYCGPNWNVLACSRPLYASTVLRDVLGRAASIQWQFGHPEFPQGSASASLQAPARPWRGITYTALGGVDSVWEHDSTFSPVSTGGLRTHQVNAAQVQMLGQSASATVWKYSRQPTVGDLVLIADGAGSERWSHSTQYAAGHQLRRVRIGGQSLPVEHDADGNIARWGQLHFEYDPRGLLAAVDSNGTSVERYFHDPLGRLVRVEAGAMPADVTEFAYDGHQMVVAYDGDGAVRWSATWGSETDHLLEWSDGQGLRWQPLADARNSVVGAWRADTMRTSTSADYSAEGRVTTRSSSGAAVCAEVSSGQVCAAPAQMPFGLFSAWRSPRTGLAYLRNRWYSSELGQFLSTDPEGYRDSFNLYAYVGFDPMNGRDPFGLGASTGEPSTNVQPSRPVARNDRPQSGASSTATVKPRQALPGMTLRETAEFELRWQRDLDRIRGEAQWHNFFFNDLSHGEQLYWAFMELHGGDKLGAAFTGSTQTGQRLSYDERISMLIDGLMKTAEVAQGMVSVGSLLRSGLTQGAINGAEEGLVMKRPVNVELGEVKAISDARKALSDAIAVAEDSLAEVGQSTKRLSPKAIGPDLPRVREARDMVERRVRELSKAQRANPVHGPRVQPPPQGAPSRPLARPYQSDWE